MKGKEVADHRRKRYVIKEDSATFFCLAQQPTVGQGLLIHEVSRPHNDASQSVGLLWMWD